jgi:hypothetical protein
MSEDDPRGASLHRQNTAVSEVSDPTVGGQIRDSYVRVERRRRQRLAPTAQIRAFFGLV